MESQLKFKTPSGAYVTLDVDTSEPILLNIKSADTESKVTVTDPTGVNSTVKFIGGREKRG